MLCESRRVTGQLVGDHDPRLGARLAVKHTTQEALGGYVIAPLLDQDVQNDSVLVNGSPEPVTFATDLQRNFVQMPHLSAARTRRRRSPAANTAPNLVHHWRMVSWLTTIPRSARRS
jgi:hypothetical protein